MAQSPIQDLFEEFNRIRNAKWSSDRDVRVRRMHLRQHSLEGQLEMLRDTFLPRSVRQPPYLNLRAHDQGAKRMLRTVLMHAIDTIAKRFPEDSERKLTALELNQWKKYVAEANEYVHAGQPEETALRRKLSHVNARLAAEEVASEESAKHSALRTVLRRARENELHQQWEREEVQRLRQHREPSRLAEGLCQYRSERQYTNTDPNGSRTVLSKESGEAERGEYVESKSHRPVLVTLLEKASVRGRK